MACSRTIALLTALRLRLAAEAVQVAAAVKINAAVHQRRRRVHVFLEPGLVEQLSYRPRRLPPPGARAGSAGSPCRPRRQRGRPRGCRRDPGLAKIQAAPIDRNSSWQRAGKDSKSPVLLDARFPWRNSRTACTSTTIVSTTGIIGRWSAWRSWPMTRSFGGPRGSARACGAASPAWSFRWPSCWITPPRTRSWKETSIRSPRWCWPT